MTTEQLQEALENLVKQHQATTTKLFKLEGAIEVLQQLLKEPEASESASAVEEVYEEA